MDNLVANPKCKSCKTYWKPCDTDILTSGLVAKSCKKCRNHQKELREKRDYQKGKIYTVRSLTSPEIYVGSTIQTLDVRMVGHRKDWKNNVVLGKKKDIVKDIDDWFIELYENYPCNNFNELTTREGEIIKQISTLNKNIAGRTKQEWRTDHKEELKEEAKQYYTDHKEQIKQRHKQYNTDHKEEIKEERKQYYTDHKEQIKQQHNQYNTDHKEQIKKNRKQFYTDHKEEEKQRHKQYYTDHKEQIKEMDKQYYTDNKEELKQRHKQYKTDHKEQIKEKQKQYYLKKKLEKAQIITE